MSEQANSTLISDLLADQDLQEQTQKEAVEEAVDKTSEESHVEEPKEAVITSELAREYGLQAWMVGKPMSELGKAYKNLNAEFTRRNQKQSDFEKRIDELESKLVAQAGTKSDKQEAKDIFEDVPDPVADPDGYKKWFKGLKSYMEDFKKSTRDEVIQQLEAPLKQVDAYNEQQRQQQILETVQEAIPQDVNLDELITEWGTEHGLIGDEEAIKSYLKRPVSMAKSIIQFYESREYKSLKADNQKQVGDEVIKKTAQTLKSVKETKATDLNSKKRTEQKPDRSTLMEQLLEDLE